MAQPAEMANRILDKALSLGEASSWEAVRLHSVADELDISLDEVRAVYPEKDDLAEAWFDRADRAALKTRDRGWEATRSVPERLQAVMLAWLEALAPHRRLTREMLGYKLEPGHIHFQALGLARISRTVQWFREAAQQDSQGLQRIGEETALTAIYLASFARWLFDDSPDYRSTRRFLQRSLQQQDRFFSRIFSGKSRPANQTTESSGTTAVHAVNR